MEAIKQIEESAKYKGLIINKKDMMLVDQGGLPSRQLKMNLEETKYCFAIVKKINYLRRNITTRCEEWNDTQGRKQKHIKCMKGLQCKSKAKNIPININKRVYNIAIIMSVVLYGSELRKINRRKIDVLETFERKILYTKGIKQMTRGQEGQMRKWGIYMENPV